jgi:hypothetical protein
MAPLILESSEQLESVLGTYEKTYLILGFSSAQFQSLVDIVSHLNPFFSGDQTCLVLYGGDRSRGERNLGDLVFSLKNAYELSVLAFICDRCTEDVECFIDIVYTVPASYDDKGNIIYGGVSNQETNSTEEKQLEKEIKLLGNTQYYLDSKIAHKLSGVIICGGGSICLQEFRYIVEHTRVPYVFVDCALPRYPEMYGNTAGPVHEWIKTENIPKSRGIELYEEV